MSAPEIVRTITLHCETCGEGAVFTNFEGDDDALAKWIDEEEWTSRDGDDYCPEHGDSE